MKNVTSYDIFELRREFSIVLQIKINKAYLYCHFFDEEEIELDISPREIINDETYQELLHFIEKLSNHLGKPAILTPENTKGYILVEFN